VNFHAYILKIRKTELSVRKQSQKVALAHIETNLHDAASH
jgi:hypothetical protein